MNLKRIITVSLTVLCLYAQDITVIFNGNNTKLMRFELDLMKELINRYVDSKGGKLKTQYKGVKEFSSSFEQLEKYNKNRTVVINQVVITPAREKKYDFSTPYMSTHYALISRKDFLNLDKKDEFKVGFVTGGIYEQLSDDLSKTVHLIKAPYASVSVAIKDLAQKKIDLYFTDDVDAWVYDLKIFQYFQKEKVSYYGFVFNKGSKMRDEINDIYAKYKTTTNYKQLIKKHFGDYSEQFF